LGGLGQNANDDGSDGNGSQRYPKARIPGVVRPADSRNLYAETPDITKNNPKFH
jgi:hypothetical protein